MINHNIDFKYQIKRHARAKALRLSIAGDGRVVLTIPKRASLKLARSFVSEKAGWVRAQLDRIRQGNAYVDPARADQDYRQKKEKARTLVRTRLDHFNRNYDFEIKRIAIRRPRTRWGSCSARGNLNFNYRIIDLPAALADYVIVHELCHLGELNHSAAFWRLVARTIPDYRERRRQLRSRHS